MSSRLELTPVELDRLEDALEDLELGPVPTGAETGDAVALRLAEFHEILQLSREALPMQGRARRSARRGDGRGPPGRSCGAGQRCGGSFWSRWRLGVWLPTLAFAGSAALLLVMLLPKGDAGTVAQGVDSKVSGMTPEFEAPS